MKRTLGNHATRMLALVLSCLAVWVATGRAQTDGEYLPRAGGPRPISRQVVSLIESGAAIGVHLPDANSASPSVSKAIAGSPRQVVVLSQLKQLPPERDWTLADDRNIQGNNDIPKQHSSEFAPTKRVTVRLDEPLVTPVQDSHDWVDLAIPQSYFDEAKIQPRGSNTPRTDTDNTTPLESLSPSLGQVETLDGMVADDRTQDQRVPGTTYTPQQAIPDWLLRQGGQQPEAVESGPSILSDDNLPPPINQSNGISGHSQESSAETSSSNSESGASGASGANHPASHWPVLTLADHHPARVDAVAQKIDYYESDFSPAGGPQGSTFDPQAALHLSGQVSSTCSKATH